MIMLGTSLAGDSTSLRPTPTVSGKISSFRLSNGEFDNFYVTKDTKKEFECGEVPDLWDYNTILWAKFNGNLNSSNISDDLYNADCLRIKRRKKNTYSWITLFEVDPREDVNGWRFTRYDKTAQSGYDYDYAIVPVANNIEGNLNITPVYSCFGGIYIFEGGEDGKSYYTHAEFDNPVTRVKPTSQIVTLGHRYPYTVSNGAANYEEGTLNGVFAPMLEGAGVLDFEKNSRYRDEVLEFMANGKVKLIKQHDGRIWLAQLTDGHITENTFSPTSVHDIAEISIPWTQIADALSGHDLYVHDFIECDLGDITID